MEAQSNSPSTDKTEKNELNATVEQVTKFLALTTTGAAAIAIAFDIGYFSSLDINMFTLSASQVHIKRGHRSPCVPGMIMRSPPSREGGICPFASVSSSLRQNAPRSNYRAAARSALPRLPAGLVLPSASRHG